MRYETVMEFITIAEAYGWRVVAGVGWCTTHRCCPMGAVVVAMNGGWGNSASVVEQASRHLRVDKVDVISFAVGFDNPDDYVHSAAAKLGQRVRREIDAR